MNDRFHDLVESLGRASSISQAEVHKLFERGQNTGAIAGGVIGGLFALVFLLSLLALILVVAACKIKQRGSGGGGGNVVVKSTKSARDNNVEPSAIPAINQQNDLYGTDDA